ncbi:UNVERIFIED_CONTAM: hypothetical protein Sradi_7033700 [Sesamum radiatum]|uniref:Uncharacterized protein n=1 Tax=Sesamum radiatum TaxID=300843 RepID=A0AAW2J929_SESRA
MANSNNGGDNESNKEDSSLPIASRPVVSPTDTILGDVNVPGPDPTPGANALVPKPLTQPSEVLKLMEQDLFLGGKRWNTQGNQGMDEEIPAGFQQDQSTPADFVSNEAAGHQPPGIWQSLKKEMVELRHQVTKETMLAEHGIPFSEHIMTEELPAHFRAPSHLSAYDGNTNPVAHILKCENAALLHMYTKCIKCHVFLNTLTNSTQQWFNQLLAGSEDDETLRACVQCFNTIILEIPIAHQEVLVSIFTYELHEGPLFESLAKKPVADYLDVLAQTEKYMNLEKAWQVRRSSRDRQRENELFFSNRNSGEPRGYFNE